ncbi:NADH-quinone oxidoreductase subunit NuoK [Geomonas sp. RF6]|uniref:NADH-quinone oxidoreductase subunit NuoK n=1 Tax=Geomonas sp. RF6 TaxID=2897342 RepID=UPI001E2C6BC3|nr:NADH-quinone oxidoreductase subunit NuoK [Geomonas sp. RF6]UFS69794.1 NADH-quinone oxidoreductase subunit NuoK [Geomonas sp. RF6]
MLMLSDNLNTYLIIAILLLALGVFGMVRHKTFIGMLISAEFILAGASLNFMAFNRFLAPNPAVGQIFTLFIMGLAAAEAAVVVSLVLMVYHQYRSIDPAEVHDLQH